MIPWLEADTPFPDTHQALGPMSDAPGLLAASADVSLPRLQSAYRHGIFPWFSDGQPVLWWTTDPRMVLPVSEFKLSRSLRKTIQRFRFSPGCEIRIDSALPQVMHACAHTPREGQQGTWILPPIQQAYQRWHLQWQQARAQGQATTGGVHSVETWMDGELVGGLYGVNVGGMFYGESMFAHRTDASKIALAALVCLCRREGITLIDCQQQTSHLASLGARPIPRSDFETHLKGVVDRLAPQDWSYHDQTWALLMPSA
jgi:leucyl/phenylalanyl-tRNA--protein transferase